MKFSEVIEGLKEGRSFTRGAWMAEAISNNPININVKHIVCQIPQTIPADIVPKMTSLPKAAKELCSYSGERTISYHDQVLCITAGPSTSATATYYIPTWEDIFAEDWVMDESDEEPLQHFDND